MGDPTNKYENTAAYANDALIARLKRERDSAYEALSKNEAEFKALAKEYANALAAIERLSSAIDQHVGTMSEAHHAVALAAPIVDAMCAMFRPFDWNAVVEADEHCVEQGPFLRDIEPNRDQACLENLRYGDLEIAAGALMQGLLQGLLQGPKR